MKAQAKYMILIVETLIDELAMDDFIVLDKQSEDGREEILKFFSEAYNFDEDVDGFDIDVDFATHSLHLRKIEYYNTVEEVKDRLYTIQKWSSNYAKKL